LSFANCPPWTKALLLQQTEPVLTIAISKSESKKGMGNYFLILDAGSDFWHRVFVIAAAIVGGVCFWYDSRSWKLRSRDRILIIMVVAYGSIFGAAFPGFLASGAVGEQVSEFFFEANARLEGFWAASVYGPKTILGGLIFGFLGVAAFKKLFNITFDTSDAFARGVVATMFVGRLGCIAQHCCFGRETHTGFGIDQGDHVLRYPVQIMEAGFLFVLLVFVDYLQRKNLMHNRRLFLTFAIYGLGRFLLEFLREPVAKPILGIGFYQWLALCLLGIAIFQMTKRHAATYNI
jgi:prolipoprotein diacylglyceryltransferase